MGLLVDIRENWATFLGSDVASGAHAYFNPSAPAKPIGIFTEKLKTIEQSITEAQMKVGLNVVIVTVQAKGAMNQIQGLYFGRILCVARIMENPKVNMTGVSASDCAEAVAWFTRKFSPEGYVMEFQDIMLASHQTALAYDVLYTIEAGTTTPPARPA